MTYLRQNDDPIENEIHGRSERIFNLAGLWYFHTREGRDIGPFRYESEAKQMLCHFVREMQATVCQSEMPPDKPHFRVGALTSRIDNVNPSAGSFG